MIVLNIPIFKANFYQFLFQRYDRIKNVKILSLIFSGTNNDGNIL